MQQEVPLGRRVALVIGNNNYKNVPRLKNAVADAEAIEKVLERSGFKVESGFNLDHSGMVSAFAWFANDLQSHRDIGIFWFSGHGIEHASKRSFLLPVEIDAVCGSKDLFALSELSLGLERMLARLSTTNATIIIVLDACRDNPFVDTPLAGQFGRITSWPGELSAVPKNLRIIYATGFNESALDDSGNPHGLFTGELLPHLLKPGMKISRAAELATESVQKKATVAIQNNATVVIQNAGQWFQGTADVELQPLEASEYSSGIDEEQGRRTRRQQLVSRVATLLAMPLNLEPEPRWQWPENLLMRIGVDRTQLIGIVAVADSSSLYEALCDTEESVIQSDPGGRFGRRRWRLVGYNGPSDDDHDRPFGLIWPIAGDVTVQQVDDAIRACLTDPKKFEVSRRAGNAVILALEDNEEGDERDDEQRVRQCSRLILERASKLKVALNICSWIETSRPNSDPGTGFCAAGVKLEGALLPIELELLRYGLQAQSTSSRDGAIAALRTIRGKLARGLQPLCDWVCEDITDHEFFAVAKTRAFQIASLAGLLTGAGVRPSPTEATRGAAVVEAAATNRHASMILAGLPICLPVLQALADAHGAVRATVGLVTNEEVQSAAPPWLGKMLDDSRGKRRLVLRGEHH